jgi:hypothetical protein
MQLGGKKPHRKEKVKRCVFNFSSGWWTHSRHAGIFEWSRFEFFFLKNVACSGYGTKTVPAKICTWYQKMVLWYISTFRQQHSRALGGSRDFFFCLVCLFAKGCIISIHFVWSRPRKSVTESVGVGRGRQVWYRWGECGRYRDGSVV